VGFFVLCDIYIKRKLVMRKIVKLTESDLVSLIKKMVSKSKVNESKEDGEKMELFYVMNDKDQVKNISKKESDAEKFLEKSLKGEGKIKSKTVYKKDYDNEKVTVSTIKNYTLNESVPGLMVTKKAQSGSKKESDLNRLVKKVIKEQEVSEFYFNTSDDDSESYKSPNRKDRMMVKGFKKEIMDKLVSGGSDWSVNNENPHLKDLINGIRRVCDKFESLN
jgi:hypothetical protein